MPSRRIIDHAANPPSGDMAKDKYHSDPSTEELEQARYKRNKALKTIIFFGLLGGGIWVLKDKIAERISQDEWFTGPIDPLSQPYEDAPQQRIESTTENTLPSGAEFNIEVNDINRPIRPGSTVKVINTEGLGLNMRTSPEVQSDWLITLPEGSKLEVIQLGEIKDGYRWALVRHTADDGSITEGWVAYADELGNPWLTTFTIR